MLVVLFLLVGQRSQLVLLLLWLILMLLIL